MTQALGTAVERTTTLTRISPSQLIATVTDPLSRQTAYSYDTSANLTALTLLAGSPSAVTATWTYEPVFHQILTATDFLNHTTTFTYDAQSLLTTVTDPLNHQKTVTINAAGQLLSARNHLNETVQFAYHRGDLVSVTTPSGSTT